MLLFVYYFTEKSISPQHCFTVVAFKMYERLNKCPEKQTSKTKELTKFDCNTLLSHSRSPLEIGWKLVYSLTLCLLNSVVTKRCYF